MLAQRRRRTYDERIADLEHRIEELRETIAARKRRAQAKAKAKEKPPGPRFSAVWLASHREKLGLSAADYAKLVGVSGLTIYNWEKGRSKPRRAQLEALAGVRGMGRREALAKLAGRSKRRKRVGKA